MKKDTRPRRSTKKATQDSWLWGGPLLFMLIIGSYFVLRFAGNWAESDSAAFTGYIRDFMAQGRLVPEGIGVYPNGYAYQAISTFVVAFTGLRVDTLQQWIYPILASLVVLPAWIAYRELTGGDRAASLSTLLLLTQPEFLFVILRSSHEKFTRMLLMICIYLLARAISQVRAGRGKAVFVGLFCFAVYALIASNYVLANSFILALAVIYAAGGILARIRPNLKAGNEPLSHILRYVLPGCLVLVYIFTFFVYPPARHNLLVAQNTWDLIQRLFLNLETHKADVLVAYDYAASGWINLPTYFLLSSANWVLLGISFVIWLRQARDWIWHSGEPDNPMAWLLWLCYAAFAVQEVLAIISDASGALSSNLQLRLFPSLSMIAAAMVGNAWAQWQPRVQTAWIRRASLVAFFCVSILSVMKATNEPLVSNKWNFYAPDELLALQWGDAHLQHSALWTEFDERLAAAYLTAVGGSKSIFTDKVTLTTRDMLSSDITRLRSERIDRPLPIPPDAFEVYDNGQAQLYHLRPLTPFQP